MLILASRSPTRKALLEQAGIRFMSQAAYVDERELERSALAAGDGPAAVARLLACGKALAVAKNHPGTVVIGADQTLSLDGTLLHKPADMAGAADQLWQLRGRTHRLDAAVALVRDGDTLWTDVQSAELTMRHFTIAERDDALAREGEAVLGSVGAYRLEGPSIRLFERTDGDYFTILGLPLLPLLAALRTLAPELLA